ncbi:uncharacterized protein LOC134747903 [Cydia strobilella]|uniref:uncharacterized protein LOC134747903 n=1 Tax=Cydia strobilella TaxID=1100964 RepID=UPI003005851A
MDSIFIIPERTEVTHVNEKYLYNVSARVIRYGRKSDYLYNLEGGIKHTWGNNITIHFVFFEAQNNQYKRSLLELKLKFCDLFQREQYIGKMLRTILDKYGISCPIAPGMYRFLNTTLPGEKTPNYLPFRKGKVEVTFNQLQTQDLVGRFFVIFTVKS